MRRRFRSRVGLLLVLCSIALGLQGVPGTLGARPVSRVVDAARLPALRSQVTKVIGPRVGVGSSAYQRPTVKAKVSSREKRVKSGNPPPVTSAISPADGAEVMTLQPTLSVNGVQDPECDAVSYRFKVTTKPDAETGEIIVDATLVATTSYTIPLGALKDGGVYYWHVTTSDPTNAGTAPGWVRAFKVDLRLGSQSIYPYDSEGPATVNLTNGNLLVGAGTPKLSSLGGALGVDFSYNSQSPAEFGLLGVYTPDPNVNHVADSGELPAMVRRDTSLAFNWGTSSAVPGLTATSMVVHWSGRVTAPLSGSNTYAFGASSSEGVKITVNGTTVYNAWSDQTAGAPVYGSSSTLTGGSSVPISIDWYRNAGSNAVMKLYVKGTGSTSLAEQLVDPSWLTTYPGALPHGWSMTPTGGASAYARAEISESKVVLYGTDDSTHTYSFTGSGYTPPAGEDGVLAWDSSGRLSLEGSDGYSYVFDSLGFLQSATSSSDSPSAPRYTWATVSGTPMSRLTTITDPVPGATSTRNVTLRYGSDSACPGSAPSGFDAAAPDGMLCSVSFWDGRITKLWYKTGLLARVQNPGSSIIDFSYDSNDRIQRIRDSLAADMIAAGQRTDVDSGDQGCITTTSTCTVIAYDSSNRVSSVTLAAPTAGASRPAHSYGYDSSGTFSVVHVAGMTEPNGFVRKVTYDGRGRQLSDIDAANLATTLVWDSVDNLLSTTNPAGLTSTMVYDHANRLTDSYGPAPSSWFGTDRLPVSGHVADVPHTTNAFDSNWLGLDVVYFNNGSLAGKPVAHSLGTDGTGKVFWDSSVALPGAVATQNWSARMTGEVLFASAGGYTISPRVGSKTKVFVDDTLVVDSTVSSSGTYTNATANTRHRVRVEYVRFASVSGTQTFGYTGSSAAWTVPVGVSAVTAVAKGAAGGTGGSSAGGAGGVITSTLSVTAGHSLTVQVAGTGASASGTSGGGGGYPNGAAGGGGGAGGGSTSAGGTSSWTGGGGGGGSTSILDSSTVLVHAAGGGGGGGSNQAVCVGGAGGAGGASTGASGSGGASGTGGGACASYGPGAGGGGASQSGGGGGGAGGQGCAQAGTAGSSSGGGVGGATGCYGYGATGGGGGGGGGYFGGGGGGSPSNNWCAGTGGGAGGGGGGSNYTAGSSTTSSQGGNTANGQLVLSWTQTFDQPLDLHWTPPSGSDAQIPAANIFPRYGITTSTTNPDARVAAVSYDHPELALATSSVIDPGGLNLTSTTTFETTTGFRRPLAIALPNATISGLAASKVSTTYYGANELRANPCDSGSTAVNQAGLSKLITAAAPGVTSTDAIVRESVYDDAGRPVAGRVQSDGSSGWVCTTYDSSGRDRVTANKDRSGATTTFDYSTIGTVTATFPDSAGITRTTSITADMLGRTRTYTDELGTITRYVYDQVGRTMEVWRQLVGSSTETQLTSATYDSVGRLSTRSDHLTGSARTTTFTYDSVGRPSTSTRHNGVMTTVTYDTLGRASHTETNSASTVPNETRTFSLGGKVTTDTTNGATLTYTYDMASRLTTVASSSTMHRYAYDANSNRCAEAADCTTPTYTYDNADRITASPYASAYTYDGHGNLTHSTGTSGNPSATISYDANDHATVIDDGTTTTTETLAPSGRVLRRQVVTNATSAVVEDTDLGYSGSGDSPAYARPHGGTTITTFLGDLTDVGGTATWALYNLHGDILGTTDAAGAYTPTPQADEFGVATGAGPNGYGWLGEHQRPATGATLGLYRMGVRLYDPHLGRFLQTDPILGGSCNDYDYACADPINNYDLSGTTTDDILERLSTIAEYLPIDWQRQYMVNVIMNSPNVKFDVSPAGNAAKKDIYDPTKVHDEVIWALYEIQKVWGIQISVFNTLHAKDDGPHGHRGGWAVDIGNMDTHNIPQMRSFMSWVRNNNAMLGVTQMLGYPTDLQIHGYPHSDTEHQSHVHLGFYH